MKIEFDTSAITGLIKKAADTVTEAAKDVVEVAADKIDDVKEIESGAYEGAKDRINKKD